jgi:hypothetical protein
MQFSEKFNLQKADIKMNKLLRVKDIVRDKKLARLLLAHLESCLVESCF